MIWNLIWIIAIVVAVYIYRKDEGYDIGENIFVGFLGGIVSGLATLLSILLLTLVIDACSNKVYVETLNTPIYANNNIYLYVENGKKEFKVYTDDKGSYMEVSGSSSSVTDDDENYIKEETEVYSNDTVKWILGTNNLNTKTKYDIHISKNSIATETKIN